MAMCFYPCLVAQQLYRSAAAAAHIMTETERMTYLMRRHKADQLAHQLIVKLHLARPGVYGRGLYHVPVVYQLHDIVEPADVAL